MFEADQEAFKAYLEQLSDDDHFSFSLYKSDELAGSILFSLTVEPR